MPVMARSAATIPITLDVPGLQAVLDKVQDVAERLGIWGDVMAEIDRARAKHGPHHDTPMGTGPDGDLLLALDGAAQRAGLYDDDNYTLDSLSNSEFEAAAKRLCQEGGEGDGTGGDSWAKILLEEFAEAMGAEDDDLDGELVQTIAMGVSMLQAHRRQRAAS